MNDVFESPLDDLILVLPTRSSCPGAKKNFKDFQQSLWWRGRLTEEINNETLCVWSYMNKLECTWTNLNALKLVANWNLMFESHSWCSKSGYPGSRSFVMARSDDESVEFMTPENRGFQAPAPWLPWIVALHTLLCFFSTSNFGWGVWSSFHASGWCTPD